VRKRPIEEYMIGKIGQPRQLVGTTRQLSYRKEDRAMHPIYGCPERFPESSLRTRLLFPKFVMSFCSDRY